MGNIPQLGLTLLSSEVELKWSNYAQTLWKNWPSLKEKIVIEKLQQRVGNGRYCYAQTYGVTMITRQNAPSVITCRKISTIRWFSALSPVSWGSGYGRGKVLQG